MHSKYEILAYQHKGEVVQLNKQECLSKKVELPFRKYPASSNYQKQSPGGVL